MRSTIVVVVMSVMVGVSFAAPGLFYAALPAPATDTRVVRDFLGNQATSYAYHDGHSSAVALSRSDVSKHLVAAPLPVAIPAPVAYAAPIEQLYHAPAAVYTASSYQYNHQYPSYHTAYAAPAFAYASPAYY